MKHRFTMTIQCVRPFALLVLLLSLGVASLPVDVAAGTLRCGATAVDVTPREFPVIRNGGFLEAQDNRVADPLHARCIVLAEGDDPKTRIAMVVVDSCMIPTHVCDRAKQLATEATGILPSRILISATHTHSAPSVMDNCLGSRADTNYREYLPVRIAESIRLANERLQPAKVGSTRVNAAQFTHCRRWVTRSDALQEDPFGDMSVHANMHPGHNNPDFIGPSGPTDPWLSLMLIRGLDDRPIAALANFSMHYYGGHPGISADYCGRFARAFSEHIAPDNESFVAIMSQGTSGDLWWGDYHLPRDEQRFENIDDFTQRLTKLAVDSTAKLEYLDTVPVRMAEQRITLPWRRPDDSRLAWAHRLNRLRGDRRPKDRPEVYAMQAVHLNESPDPVVVLQAIRIGDLGITGIPNEVYALTGLKLKYQSPFPLTFNISLANGATGYIPPPEQHRLGGYTTWPATTAGLEVMAEPKIVDRLLVLLEDVAERPRRTFNEIETPFSQHVRATKPIAYWRLADFQRQPLQNSVGDDHPLTVDGDVALHVPGRDGEAWGQAPNSHSLLMAGGRLSAKQLPLSESFSVQLSFRLGIPCDQRDDTGVLVSRGRDELRISGTKSDTPGRLLAYGQVGTTEIQPHRWHHVVFVRNGNFVEVYLDGRLEPEISTRVERDAEPNTEAKVVSTALHLANTSDDRLPFEGKLDEVSVYDRALTKIEIRDLFSATGLEVSELKAFQQLDSAPHSPSESMQRIHIASGYQVELVAAEPLVRDPVAIDWGMDGKLWVAEMADYPLGLDGQGKPGGRIRFLEDSDGDGTYDRSVLFLDEISFPNGIMAWKNGVLVTAAPDIFYAEDTDGDGSADVRRTILTGFVEGNQQLRVNGLRWGLDHLIHCASGAHHAGFGKSNAIRSLPLKEEIQLGSRDFAFDPETGRVVPQSGPSQFGRVRDDFGNWYGVQNSQPLWHYVLRDHDLRRNQMAATIDPRQQLRTPRMPRVFSAKPPQRRFHGFDHAGHYTSACGISIYRDDVLFSTPTLHAFTCEPFHNLVQHHTLRDRGVSFTGRRAGDGPIDFFASSDRWTRPVMTRTGPNGGLWIVDMYRYMIEHPDWLPDDGRSALRAGYRAGDDKGRIYRIVRTSAKPTPQVPINLTQKTAKDVAELINSSNGTQRDLAHRWLLSQALDAAVLAALSETAQQSPRPEVRIQALSILSGLNQLTHDLLLASLQDAHYSVRRYAVELASIHHEALDDPTLQSQIEMLTDDTHAKVQLELAVALGNWNEAIAGRCLARLAMRCDDQFMEAAVVSSLTPHVETIIETVGDQIEALPDNIYEELLKLAKSKPRLQNRLLERLTSPLPDGYSATQVVRVADWLSTSSTSRLAKDDAEPLNTHWTEQLKTMISAARTALANPNDMDRIELARSYVLLLGHDQGNETSDANLLLELFQTTTDDQTRDHASRRLAAIAPPQTSQRLLDAWQALLPKQRTDAVELLLQRPAWQRDILDAISAGTLSSHDLTLPQQQLLLNSKRAEIASRAKASLDVGSNRAREQVVADYQPHIRFGERNAGETVFRRECATCHTLADEQEPVGPDLRAVTDRSDIALLQSILNPNRTIEPKYANYQLALKNGVTLTGVVSRDDHHSIVLHDASGKQHQVPREAIEVVHRSTISLMPEGLEAKITPTEMADLIAFLQAL